MPGQKPEFSDCIFWKLTAESLEASFPFEHIFVYFPPFNHIYTLVLTLAVVRDSVCMKYCSYV